METRASPRRRSSALDLLAARCQSLRMATPPRGISEEQDDSPTVPSRRVFVTGASGFVGQHVVSELLGQGYAPICLVRSRERLMRLLPEEQWSRVLVIEGDILDPAAAAEAAAGCAAAIHLVGIIEEKPRTGQTFTRMHVDATRAVVEACKACGVARYAHMSALGARPDAPSRYHQTKWQAEELVRHSGLAWTIFRPSLIHGPDGEFMRMMKFFSTSLRSPVMPYFGDGRRLLQPVSGLDVAQVFAGALALPQTIGQVYELGGPERLTWRELYDACALAITGHKRLQVPVPVPLARLLAIAVMPLAPSFLVPYKFNVDQVIMSQEDSVCDPRPVEELFGISLRSFLRELSSYADRIG
jgi:uncharacterized protein YbjT (DUF2867 family)